MVKKKILSLALAVLTLICALVAISFVKKASVYSVSLVFDTENALKERYFQNEVLTVPSAKISVNGTEYAADERVIHYPNGKAYTSAIHTLRDVGEYSVEYFALVNGKKISESAEFTVVKDTYGISGGVTVEAVSSLTKKEGENDGGLSVSIPDGGRFVYNQPINISSSDRTTPIIELYPYNKNSVIESYYVTDENGDKILDSNGKPVIAQRITEEAVAEARIFVLRITDCYDENNYVEVYIDWNLTNPGHATLGKRREATCTAAASGQKKTSLIPNPNGNTSKWYANKTVDGKPYLLTMSSSYGKGCSYDESTGISIFYEYKTNRIYIKDKNEYLLTDLDDPNLYFTAPLVIEGGSYVTGAPFKGFSTGEVYISAYCEEYYQNEAHFEIASLCGISGQKLSEREVKDDVKPTVSVDVKEGRIFIAKGEEFKIFNATANDLSGIKDFDSKVYFDYGGERQSLIGVKNNSFTPTRTGVYTIEYTATDIFGNTTIKTVDVLCVNAEKGKSIGFDFVVSDSYKAGERHELYYDVFGLNGEVNVSAYAVYSGESDRKILSVIATKQGKGYIEFEPSEVGKYEIIVICKDGVVEKTFTYEVTVTPSEKAYLTPPVLPEYLIAGAEYTFDYNEIIYFDGATASEHPTVYVSVDGKEKALIDYEDYFVPETAEKIKFLYFDGETKLGESKELEIVKVKNNGALSMSKYFKGDFTAKAVTSFIEFTSNKTSGDNEMAFINVVSLDNFYLAFSTGLEYFTAFDVTLINYYDRNEKFTYSFYEKGANTEIALINAEGEELKKTTVSKKFHDSTFFMQYNSKTGMTESGANAGIAEISSDKVLVHFTMRGLSGKGSVKLRQLNNQPLSNADFDVYGANFTVYSAIGSLEKGGEITLVPSDVSDVLSPYLKRNFKMTVSDVNDKIMTAVDGTILNSSCDPTKAYTVKLEEYGTYTVRYSYTDWTGETVPKTLTIEVLDRIPPEIKLTDGYGEKTLIKTSAGKKLKLAGYEISDNDTEKEDLTVAIVVINPRNETVKTEGLLELNLKGEYKVYYYCYDAYGNYSYTYYTVMAI